MSATRNWTIAGATTVALGTVTGIAFPTDGIELQDRADAIQLASATKFADGTADEVIGVDVSPESADSPADPRSTRPSRRRTVLTIRAGSIHRPSQPTALLTHRPIPRHLRRPAVRRRRRWWWPWRWRR